MEGDQHAVTGAVDVCLEIAVAETGRDLECLERVLWRLAGAASVRERDRTPWREERVRMLAARFR